MMWAPIANNVISVAVLVIYIVAYGQAEGAEVHGAFSSGQELLLGLGSTLGIVVQLLILVPYLRRAGFAYRPRLDLRGSGLGHTLRLGIWTVLFVIVNQIAYIVVQRLATGGAAESPDGTGFTVYSFSFLVVMVPHSIVTVSLATAMLTTLSAHAAAGDRAALAGALASTLRAALAVIVPVRRAAARDRARPGPGGLRARRRGRGRCGRLRARRSRCSASASCSSPSTTWCCAASTRSS